MFVSSHSSRSLSDDGLFTESVSFDSGSQAFFYRWPLKKGEMFTCKPCQWSYTDKGALLGAPMVAKLCPLCLLVPNHEHVVPYFFFPARPPQTSWVHQCICLWWELRPTSSCVTTDSRSHAYSSTIHPQYNPAQREIEKFLTGAELREHLRKLKNMFTVCCSAALHWHGEVTLRLHLHEARVASFPLSKRQGFVRTNSRNSKDYTRM